MFAGYLVIKISFLLRWRWFCRWRWSWCSTGCGRWFGGRLAGLAGRRCAAFRVCCGVVLSQQAMVQADLVLEKDEPVGIFANGYTFRGMQWGSPFAAAFDSSSGPRLTIPWFRTGRAVCTPNPLCRRGCCPTCILCPRVFCRRR